MSTPLIGGIGTPIGTAPSQQKRFSLSGTVGFRSSAPALLRQYRLHHAARHIRKPEVAPLELVCQPGVIDAQRMQDSRVQVVYVYGIFHDVVAIIVGLAESDARLDAASGQPHGEAAGMMIAAVVVLGQFALAIDGPAKLAAPDHQRI